MACEGGRGERNVAQLYSFNFWASSCSGARGGRRETSPRNAPSVGATDKDQLWDCRPVPCAVRWGAGRGHASCSQIWLLKSDDARHLSLGFRWNWACGWCFLKCPPDDSEVYPGLKSVGLEGPGRPGEGGAGLVGRIEKGIPGKEKHVGTSGACRGSS